MHMVIVSNSLQVLSIRVNNNIMHVNNNNTYICGSEDMLALAQRFYDNIYMECLSWVYIVEESHIYS